MNLVPIGQVGTVILLTGGCNSIKCVCRCVCRHVCTLHLHLRIIYNRLNCSDSRPIIVGLAVEAMRKVLGCTLLLPGGSY